MQDGLTRTFDGLTHRFDGLTDKFDGLTRRFDFLVTKTLDGYQNGPYRGKGRAPAASFAASVAYR